MLSRDSKYTTRGVLNLFSGGVRAMSKKHINPVNTRLFQAVRDGGPGKIYAAAAAGADVNAVDSSGETPVMHAIRMLKTENIRTLLALGADPNYGGMYGPAPLTANCLWNYGSPGAQVTRMLLEAGANVNAADGDGFTALMGAVRYGLEEGVKILVDAGADVNARTNRGRTVLMEAAFNGWGETARFLIERGADVHARDKNGNTALMESALAAESGDILVFTVLASAGGMEDISPGEFCVWLKSRKDLPPEEAGTMCLVALVSIIPARCPGLEEMLSGKRSRAAGRLLLEEPFPLSGERFLQVMLYGKGGAITLRRDETENLVKILLDVFETNPGLVFDFIRRRIGRTAEKWVKKRVPGADILVSRMAAHNRQNRIGTNFPES